MPKSKKAEAESTVEVPAAIATMMAVNPVMAKAWMDLMSEGTRFLTDRLQRDIAFQQRMLACRDPMEFMQLQTEFVRDTMEQYAEEASRAFKMAFQSAEEIEEDVRHGHKRAYNDVPV